MNLNQEVEKPRMTRITQITIRFGESRRIFYIHPPGKSPLSRQLLFIREIREISGFDCLF